MSDTFVSSIEEYVNLRNYPDKTEERKAVERELLGSHPYSVPVKLSYGLYLAITDWVRENNIDGYVYFNKRYHFKNEIDAAAFKLIFG